MRAARAARAQSNCAHAHPPRHTLGGCVHRAVSRRSIWRNKLSACLTARRPGQRHRGVDRGGARRGLLCALAEGGPHCAVARRCTRPPTRARRRWVCRSPRARAQTGPVNPPVIEKPVLAQHHPFPSCTSSVLELEPARRGVALELAAAHPVGIGERADVTERGAVAPAAAAAAAHKEPVVLVS